MGNQIKSNKRAIKPATDGRVLLNLGCGTTTSADWNNVDFSPYARLRKMMWLAQGLRRLGLLSPLRFQRLSDLDADIIYWDIRKGIPFQDGMFDAVYHSHFLEHLSVDDAVTFLSECCRVLKRNGILRIAVPDLETIGRFYVQSLDLFDREGWGTETLEGHRQAISALFDQMVREQITGSKEQNPIVRLLESLFRGSAADAGELHRWMYDKYSLQELLLKTGFGDIRVEDPYSSRIEGWRHFALDTDNAGNARHPGSLYLEGAKKSDAE
jgi:SAM-dependent methyltransferase